MYVQIIRFQLKYVSEEESVILSNDLSSTFVGVPGLIPKVWLADSSIGTCGIDCSKDYEAIEAFTKTDLYSPVTTGPDLANLTPTECAVMEESTGVARGLVDSNRDCPCLSHRLGVIFQQGGAR